MYFSRIVKGISGRLSNLMRNLRQSLRNQLLGHYAAPWVNWLATKEGKRKRRKRGGKKKGLTQRNSFICSSINITEHLQSVQALRPATRDKVTVSAIEKLKVSWEWQPRNEPVFPSQTQRKPLPLSCSYCSRDSAHDGCEYGKNSGWDFAKTWV